MNPEARVKKEAFEGFGFSLEGVLSCVALKNGKKKGPKRRRQKREELERKKRGENTRERKKHILMRERERE